MKLKMVLFIIVALFFLMGAGCEKESLIYYNDINIVYERCNKSIDYPINGEIKKRDILLFDLNQIKEPEIIKLFSGDEVIEYVLYDSNLIAKNKITYRRIRIDNAGDEYGSFCNFPIDILGKLSIPKTGLHVSFSGDLIITKFTTDALSSTFDISLKSLKIQRL